MNAEQTIDPTKLKLVHEWSSQDIVFCLAASEDASRLWFGSSDAGVYEMDVPAENPQRRKLEGEGHSSYVTGMARIGDQLVTCGYDKRLIWWDLRSGKQLRAILAHDRWIRAVIPFPDGSRLITVADDMRCRVWDGRSARMLADFTDHHELTPQHYPSMLYAVAVSADGSRIATGDRVGHVAIWDANNYRKLSVIDAPEMYTWDPRQRRHSIGGIRSLAFSPDGSKLAVGGIGKVGNIDHLGGASRLEIFDIASADRLVLAEDEKNKGLVETIAWSPDGNWVLTAGGADKGFLCVYDSSTGNQIHASEHGGHIHTLYHDPDYSNLFVGAHQRMSQWAFSATS